jgi:hypothetical protein
MTESTSVTSGASSARRGLGLSPAHSAQVGDDHVDARPADRWQSAFAHDPRFVRFAGIVPHHDRACGQIYCTTQPPIWSGIVRLAMSPARLTSIAEHRHVEMPAAIHRETVGTGERPLRWQRGNHLLPRVD